VGKNKNPETEAPDEESNQMWNLMGHTLISISVR
jgi:hypothetical protein